MSTRLARFTLAIALTACSATPDLKFSVDDGGEPDATTGAAIDGSTGDATKPNGGRDAQGGGTDDATFADGAPNDDATVDAAAEGDAPLVDAAKPHDAAVSDTSVPDASVADTFVPDSGIPPFDASTLDASLVCKPNLQFGIDCCPNGDQCVGLACQNCQDCSNCGLPNFCCAIVNGGGKYKGMKCSPTSVGCP